MSLSKPEALAQLSKIIDEHKLSKNDVMSLFPQEDRKYKFALVSYFLGGLLLLTGVTFLVGLVFDDLNPVFQIALTLGLAVTLFASACWVQTKNVPLATALFMIPVFLEPFGFAVFAHHMLSDTFVHSNMQNLTMAVFGFMALQYFTAGLYLSKVKALLPIGILYFSAFFITVQFPLEEGYQFLEAFSWTAIFAVMFAQAYYFEKRSSRTGWMDIPYAVGTLGIIVSGGYFLTFDLEMMMAELCAMAVAFFMFYLGKSINRSSVVWISAVAAVLAYCAAIFNVYESTYVTAVMLILGGLVALFSFKRFHKKAL